MLPPSVNFSELTLGKLETQSSHRGTPEDANGSILLPTSYLTCLWLGSVVYTTHPLCDRA